MSEDDYYQLGENLSALEDYSPYLTRQLSLSIEEDQIAVVNEWAEYDLESFIERYAENGLPDSALFRTVHRLLNAVIVLCERGLETDDIKPSNVMLFSDPDGPLDFKYEVKLGDNGFSRFKSPKDVQFEQNLQNESWRALGVQNVSQIIKKSASGLHSQQEQEFKRPRDHPLSKLYELMNQSNLRETAAPEFLLRTAWLAGIRPPLQVQTPKIHTHLPLNELLQKSLSEYQAVRVISSACQSCSQLECVPDMRPRNFLVELSTMRCMVISAAACQETRGAIQTQLAQELAQMCLGAFGKCSLEDDILCLLGRYADGYGSVLQLSDGLQRILQERRTDKKELARLNALTQQQTTQIKELEAKLQQFELEKASREDEITELRNSASRFAQSQKLFKQQIYPESQTSPANLQMTALQLAVRTRQKEWVSRLFSNKVQAESLSPTEYRLAEALLKPCRCGCRSLSLIDAARMGCEACCCRFLAEVRRVEGAEKNFALAEAARNGSAGCVMILMEAECGMQTKKGETALMLAVEQGDAEVVQLLVGFESRLRDVQGRTALMRAAVSGRLDLVKVLIEETGIATPQGQTALYAAMNARAPAEVVCQLAFSDAERTKAGLTALMVFSYVGDIEGVLDNMEDVEKQDQSGRTALMYAARQCNICCVEVLLREVLCQDDEKNTALIHAAQCGCARAASVLSRFEAGIKNKSGLTALMVAAFSGNGEVVSAIVETETGVVGPEGKSALCFAIEGF